MFEIESKSELTTGGLVERLSQGNSIAAGFTINIEGSKRLLDDARAIAAAVDDQSCVANSQRQSVTPSEIVQAREAPSITGTAVRDSVRQFECVAVTGEVQIRS